MVIDASVVLKWFLEERDRDKAVLLREAELSGAVSFAAPSLLLYEAVNILSRESSFSESDVRRCLKSMETIQISELSVEDNLRVVHWARKYSISGYDASYLALAHRLDCDFVTADTKLARKVHGLKFVRTL